ASLEEAARLLGSPPSRTLVRIVLPQAREAIAAGTLLVFLYGLSDFGAVSLMRFDTITRAIFSSRLFDRSTSLTLGLVLAILALAVVAVERAVPRRTSVATTESEPVRYALGTGTWPALGFVGGVLTVAFVVPVAVFTYWTLRGSTTVGVGFSRLGDGLGFLAEPLLNSAGAAIAAAIVAAVVVLPVAYASVRRRSLLTDSASSIVTAVFALPGLVVALAVVFWAIQSPGPLAAVYQSFPLLILGYVLHFGAQSMRATQSAVAGVPARLDEAARVLGADTKRTFRDIDLPLIAPGLIAGAGLVLLSTLKELPATLLLAPIGFETLATRIWSAAEDGFFAEVGVTSLVLILLSGVLTWLLILRRESTL
ncbi:MAG: ABC transporter permease, partial [Acidimicrobiia bacterium]